MKFAFFPVVIATSLAVTACAHTADNMAAVPASQLSVAQIKAEIIALSAQSQTMHQDGYRASAALAPSSATQSPTQLYVSDSNGVPITAYAPGAALAASPGRSFPSSSRPFDHARIEAMAKRRAELYAELSKRAGT